MRGGKLLVAIVLAVSATAQAQMNVWERAIQSDTPERAAQDKYDSEMRQGDEFAMKANVRNAGLREIKQQIQNALTSYRAAAAARPTEGEPYYRIGKLLYTMYFDCTGPVARARASLLCDITGRIFDRRRAEEVIAAWDAFEARSPLDPRLTVGVAGESEILFDRAILHTKLATRPHLEAAAADYEKMLARNDGSTEVSLQVLGNLAETYMMIGRMDDALETYRQALRVGADTSTTYGYAVALDRDESTRHALDVIKGAGPEGRLRFRDSVADGVTFFVPDGEKYYYFALSDEAFGLDNEAIDNWRKYIASGAHPEFQRRAKAHLDALLAKKKRKAVPIDAPWSEMFR